MNLDEYKRRLGLHGSSTGEAIKNRSDKTKDAMFKYDVGYRKCYILKDGQIFPRQNAREYCKAKAVFFGRSSYTPEDLDQFQEIECKYSTHTYKSISSSDDPDYYVEFRPNEHKRNKNIRVGAMIFIPDDVGVYNLWLIVATDKRPQFPQYYVLQMNWLLKFGTYQSNVMGSDRPQIYFQWCVNRARNSYNSGVWTDYVNTYIVRCIGKPYSVFL